MLPFCTIVHLLVTISISVFKTRRFDRICLISLSLMRGIHFSSFQHNIFKNRQQSILRNTINKAYVKAMKLSIYWSIDIPNFTYGHKLWVMTKRTRLGYKWWNWAFSEGCLGSSWETGWGSQTFQRGSEYCIERSQLRWFGRLSRMPPGCILGEMFRACWTGKRPRGRPRTHCRGYISRNWLGRKWMVGWI